MHILVDMDGVIADFEGGVESALRERNVDLLPREQRSRFSIRSSYPREHRRLIGEIMCRPGFFRELEPIEGAKEALEHMRRAGHEVTICTSPYVSNTTCMPDKREWVREHLGEAFASSMVLTQDKTAVHGDVLIDDRPEVEGRFTPTWQHVYFDQPYNRDIDRPRIRSWDEWEQVLEQVQAAS